MLIDVWTAVTRKKNPFWSLAGAKSVCLSVVMCLILTCFRNSCRPVSVTSTPRVKFTNRRKEKPLPAPNVVMTPRRPKTSACQVSCTHCFTVKKMFSGNCRRLRLLAKIFPVPKWHCEQALLSQVISSTISIKKIT